MTEDKLEFLDETPEATEAEPAPEPETVTEPEAAPEPEGTGEIEAAPPAAEEREGKFVPITALLDERDKRKSLEAKLAEYERRQREFDARRAQPKAPDVFENPEAYTAYMQQQIEAAQWNAVCTASEQMAVKEYGKDVVDEAMAAFQEAHSRNPSIYGLVRNKPHPFAEVVNWHRREKFLAEVQDPDQWRQSERERLRAELLAELQQRPGTSPAPTPPRSLASAPAATGSQRAPGTAFDQIFGD